MIQSTGSFGFLLEAFNQLGSIGEVPLNGDCLECDCASDHLIMSFVDDAHRTAS